MRDKYCPVCAHILTGDNCHSCGYRQSKDYGVYLAIGKKDESVLPVSNRRRQMEDERIRYQMDGVLREFALKMEQMSKDYRTLAERVKELERKESILEQELLQCKETMEYRQLGLAENAKQKTPDIPMKQEVKLQKNIPRSEFLTTAQSWKVGNEIDFGSFPYDYSRTMPLKWQILTIDRARRCALVITRDVIECKPYSTSTKMADWGSSTLAEWLNTAFIDAAFSQKEQTRILWQDVSFARVNIFGIKNMQSIRQRVFLFSDDEAETYLIAAKNQMAKPTPYTKGKGIWTDKSTGNCNWWLRSMGTTEDKASYMNFFGNVERKGYLVRTETLGVRPAMWISVPDEFSIEIK